ncbi:MAG: hypothetical protein DRP27_04185 [Thermotogae bacterium]|nr:MAG: hypothetical protein DRP27_04185 [Thermotogota bacterium]
MVPSLNVEVRLFRDILLVTNAAINCTEYRLVIKTKEKSESRPALHLLGTVVRQKTGLHASALWYIFL